MFAFRTSGAMPMADEAQVSPVQEVTSRARAAREVRAAVELWLLPLAIALLPYRAGLALGRLCARRLRLYEDATAAAAAQWRSVDGNGSESEWKASYRLALLVDHADLYWSLLRSRRFLLRHLDAPALSLPHGRPLVVVSFHFGQGLWLLHWLAALGRSPRLVALRVERKAMSSALEHAYARLRNWQVGRLACVPPIFTGGARQAIAQTLAQGETIYGLIDVPVAGPRHANCALFGRPARLPTGFLEAAATSGAATLVVSSRLDADGSRIVEARFESDASITAIAHELELRVRRAPAAWHFWHLWPALQAAG